MKKCMLGLCVFLLLFAAGCGESEHVADGGNVEYEEGVYDNKSWDNIQNPFSGTCIQDKDAAVTIATAIVSSFQESGYFGGYAAQKVFYDTQDKLWIVSFRENNEQVGADFSIALRAENAQVVKMWVGE